MEKQVSERSAVKVLSPIDWGLVFSLSHKRILLLFMLLPCMMEIGVAYVLYVAPTALQEKFLLESLRLGANAWLIGAVGMFAVETAQGARGTFSSIAFRALRSLPKIFLSYIFVIAFVGVFFVVPVIALLVALLLVWAPMFCIGETCIEQEGGKPDVLHEEPLEPNGAVFSSSSLPQFFRGKSLWELGHSRSFQLAKSNIIPSLQMVILLWFASIVPSAVVLALLGDVPGFSVRLLQVLCSSVADVFVVGVWAGAFSMLLPPAAKKELVVEDYIDPRSFSPKGKVSKFRLGHRIAPNLLLVAFSLMGSWSLLEHAKKQSDFPPSAQSEIQSALLDGEYVVVKLRLEDQRQKFRWLSPESIVLSLEDLETSQEPLVPVGVKLSRTDGSALEGGSLSPFSEPLLLELSYEKTSNVSEDTSFALRYRSLNGVGEPFITGRLGASW